jgi:orotate phosphoribosyltransferase
VPKFDKESFHRFLIDSKTVGFFDQPVTLSSGRRSHWYVNWRTVTNDVCLMDQLADFLIDFVAELGLKPDAFYGVPEGATKLGLIATYKWAKAKSNFGPGSAPLPMGRGQAKEHGSPADRFFIGEPRGEIVVVEDVTTTGSSLLAALDQLKPVGVTVLAAIGLTNRMERRDDGMSVEQAVKAKGITYYALSQATDFLPQIYRALSPRKEIGQAIEEEFRKYGVKPLKLI